MMRNSRVSGKGEKKFNNGFAFRAIPLYNPRPLMVGLLDFAQRFRAEL